MTEEELCIKYLKEHSDLIKKISNEGRYGNLQ